MAKTTPAPVMTDEDVDMPEIQRPTLPRYRAGMDPKAHRRQLLTNVKNEEQSKPNTNTRDNSTNMSCTEALDSTELELSLVTPCKKITLDINTRDMREAMQNIRRRSDLLRYNESSSQLLEGDVTLSHEDVFNNDICFVNSKTEHVELSSPQSSHRAAVEDQPRQCLSRNNSRNYTDAFESTEHALFETLTDTSETLRQTQLTSVVRTDVTNSTYTRVGSKRRRLGQHNDAPDGDYTVYLDSGVGPSSSRSSSTPPARSH